MDNQQLVSYIQSSMQQGRLEPAIREVLIDSGWRHEEVDHAFIAYHRAIKSVAPLPPPVPPSPEFLRERRKATRFRFMLVTGAVILTVGTLGVLHCLFHRLKITLRVHYRF